MMADKHPNFQGRLMALLTFLGGSSIMALLLLADKVGVYSDAMIFWVAMYLALMFSFFGSPLTALVDSSVLKILGDQKILYGNQRLWGSISNGVCIFAVGIMVSALGIRSSFYLFGVGMVCLILFCMMMRFDNDGTMKTMDDEQQRLLSKSEVRGNYAYNPQHQQSGDVMEEEDEDQQSRRSSILSNHTSYAPPPFFSQYQQQQQSSIWRRNSTASHANTLLLEDDVIDDDASSRRGPPHPLLYTLTATSTMYAAMDAQYEASQVLSNMDQQDYPSIGLALSHIPTVETSLAAFSLIGQQDGLGGPVLSLKKSSLKSLRVQTFLMMVLLFGLSYSMISQFLFLIYRNDLGMKPSLMGLTGPLAGVAEVTAFWLSKKLFDRFSVTTLIAVAHIMFVFRNLVFMSLKRDDSICIVIALGLQMINGKMLFEKEKSRTHFFLFYQYRILLRNDLDNGGGGGGFLFHRGTTCHGSRHFSCAIFWSGLWTWMCDKRCDLR
ncbi:unnamed protein product [Absidia cylindrospora]